MEKKSINLINFTKHYFKEIAIALVCAIIAGVAIEVYKSNQEFNIIKRNTKAVATVFVLNDKHELLGQGSGIFIKPDGTLITNFHVINIYGMTNVEAKLPSGAYYKLNRSIPIKANAHYDIAILKFDASDNPFAKMGDSDLIKQGESVMAIGSPLGLGNSISSGIISNPKRQINNLTFIQFTAPISPGSSGGGLFQSDKIIGLTKAYLSNAENVNLAVPINLVKNTLGGKETMLTENSPQYYYSLAVIEDDKHNYDQAIQYYEKAISLDNNFSSAYMGLGGDFYEKGDYAKEVKYYEKAVEIDPNNYESLYYLGTAYEDIGYYSKAINKYLKVLTIKPDYKDAIHDLALLYIVNGEKSAASKWINKLQALDKGSANELQIILGRAR